MKTEIDLLNTIKIGKEDKSKYISLTGEKKLLKVDNNENIPFNILYTEENCDPNEPIIDINNISTNIVIKLQQIMKNKQKKYIYILYIMKIVRHYSENGMRIMRVALI